MQLQWIVCKFRCEDQHWSALQQCTSFPTNFILSSYIHLCILSCSVPLCLPCHLIPFSSGYQEEQMFEVFWKGIFMNLNLVETNKIEDKTGHQEFRLSWQAWCEILIQVTRDLLLYACCSPQWDNKMTSVVVYLEAQMMIDCCQLATVLDNDLMMKKPACFAMSLKVLFECVISRHLLF